jgi:hypothetical protein
MGHDTTHPGKVKAAAKLLLLPILFNMFDVSANEDLATLCNATLTGNRLVRANYISLVHERKLDTDILVESYVMLNQSCIDYIRKAKELRLTVVKDCLPLLRHLKVDSPDEREEVLYNMDTNKQQVVEALYYHLINPNILR